VQRIRQEKQSRNQFWMLSNEQRALASTIRMSAEENSAGDEILYASHRVSQTLAVAKCVSGSWRAGGPHLAKGQIAAENEIPGLRKQIRESNQKRRVAVGACAVRQNKSVAGRLRRTM